MRTSSRSTGGWPTSTSKPNGTTTSAHRAWGTWTRWSTTGPARRSSTRCCSTRCAARTRRTSTTGSSPTSVGSSVPGSGSGNDRHRRDADRCGYGHLLLTVLIMGLIAASSQRRRRPAMKRPRYLLAALAVAAVTAAGVVIATVPAHAANLLSNPGFETGSLSPWSCTGGLGSVVSSPVHSGTRALQGAASSTDNAKCTQTVSVLPSTAYVLSAWVRGNYVHLGVTGGSLTWTPSATSYTQLSLSFTTGSAQSSIEVFLHGWYAQGTYYADDVSLDGPGGTPAVPGTPGTPTLGTITDTSIALSWGASSGTVSGYRVYEGTTVRATVTGTSATVTGLATCSTHTFTVAAFNSAGESPKSGAVTGTTTGCGTGVPGKPGTPTIGSVTSSSIALSWGASSGTVSGYRVYEGTTVRATVTGTSATVTGLATCSTHTFTVAAFNTAGESPKSGAVTGTTTGCGTGVPGKPGTPTIGSVTSSSIALSWGASSGTV